MLEKRKNISEEYIKISDKKICEEVLKLSELKRAETVFCYVSTPEEIDTQELISKLLKNGKRVAVPRCEGKGLMRAYEIKSLKELQSGAFGIMEPKEECPLVAPSEIDMAVIPCLACSKDGKRLGYGGGFYDRYLENTKFDRVILCREKQILSKIPTDKWDQPMNIIIVT